MKFESRTQISDKKLLNMIKTIKFYCKMNMISLYVLRDFEKSTKAFLLTSMVLQYFFFVQVNTHWLQPPEAAVQRFLRKGVLKICSKFTEDHSCRSAISRNRTSAWVFSSKFAAYFQSIFLRTPLDGCFWTIKID